MYIFSLTHSLHFYPQQRGCFPVLALRDGGDEDGRDEGLRMVFARDTTDEKHLYLMRLKAEGECLLDHYAIYVLSERDEKEIDKLIHRQTDIERDNKLKEKKDKEKGKEKEGDTLQ